MNIASLKYLAELQKINLQPCPCVRRFKEQNTRAYRWVFAPLGTDSFLPQALKSPKNNGLNCEDWSLSLFASQQTALKRYLDLKKRAVPVSKCFGTHIATLDINSGSGVVDTPNVDGHFDLHEYNENNLPDNVVQNSSIEDLVSGGSA